MVNLTIRLGGSSLCMKGEHHSLRSSSVRKGPAVPLNVAGIDVPILRGLGISSLEAYVATFVGSKVRRQPGDKVHVCVRCNFPIAVYGRLWMLKQANLELRREIVMFEEPYLHTRRVEAPSFHIVAYVLVVLSKTRLYLSRDPSDIDHICLGLNIEYVADPLPKGYRRDPCEHVYCLMCAKLDSTCFLCDERVVRIQKMDVLEGIFICGAPCCLRSFFTRSEFESHVAEVHSQLLEQEKISSVKTISMAISVSQGQTQLLHAGQNHVHMTGVQEPVSTLHVIFPKKEEPQWKSPESLWQHFQSVVAQPVPELQLPNQFPHHCAENLLANSLSHCSGHDLDTRERYQGQQGRKERPIQTLGQRDTETEVDWTHEGQSLERGGESGLNQSTQKREDSEWQYSRPFAHAPPREIQQEHLLHQPTEYQPVTLLPAYPLPTFSPRSLQQEQSSFPSQFESLWGFHPGTPIPFHSEYHENTSQLRNLTPIGMQQGDRLMNMTPQDGIYQVGPLRPLLGACGRGVLPRPSNGNQQKIVRQNGPLLHFLNDFGLPLGISHMSAIRFQEGHLPPPPPGPPPKRVKCNGNSGPDLLVPGEVMMDHMWGPGNPGSFGGHPGEHAF